MKIYTKIGDKGETRLANGSRIKKSSLRIDAYGNLDELNAHIGHLRDFLKAETNTNILQTKLINSLFRIQEELFEIGAELALAPLMKGQKLIGMEDVKILEDEIDSFWEACPPLRNFILPGGHLANSQAHICRCVCRRSERALVDLNDEDPVRSELLIYLNRLSDWFFAASRTIAQTLGIEELIWKSEK